MAWLLVCPFHKLGIAGLVFFFITLYFQPNIINDSENLNFLKKNTFLYYFFDIKKFIAMFSSEDSYIVELNLVYQSIFSIFFMCGLYTFSFLPYGRFYNRLGGNFGMLGAYFFLFAYLIFPSIRQPKFIELYVVELLTVAARARSQRN